TCGRIRRAAFLGFGLLLGSGLAGCMDDKKLPSANKNPGTGLPGTPTINGGTASRTGGPGGVNVNSPGGGMTAGGLQQAGATTPGGGYPGANPNNYGTVGTPARPGYGQPTGYGQQPQGYGQQYGQQPSSQQYPAGVVPQVTPNNGYQMPAGYQ